MGRESLEIAPGFYHCHDCDGVFSAKDVNAEGYCKPCWGHKAREIGRKRYMSNQKSLMEATKKLADEIAIRSKNTALSPEFFDSFAKSLGGPKGLGERLAKDFRRLHGDDLTAEEQQFFTPDEKTIQRYWQTIAQFMQNQDKMNAVDISSLSDQELQATLLNLATGLIKENEDFRKHVIKIACKSDKSFIEELAREAGLLTFVEGKVVSEISEESIESSDEVYPEDIEKNSE